MRLPDSRVVSSSLTGKYAREVKPFALVGRKHSALHEIAVPVSDVDGEVRQIARRMAATLHRHAGLALAAPQVGISLRLVVTRDAAIANPTVIPAWYSIRGPEPEGCLSLPGRWFNVPRCDKVHVSGRDVFTDEFYEGDLEGLHARLWQHEVGHCDGVLISDEWPEIRMRDFEENVT